MFEPTSIYAVAVYSCVCFSCSVLLRRIVALADDEYNITHSHSSLVSLALVVHIYTYYKSCFLKFLVYTCSRAGQRRIVLLV